MVPSRRRPVTQKCSIRLLRYVRSSVCSAPANFFQNVPSTFSEFCVPDAYDHHVHVTHHPSPFSRTATTSVDIKHSAFKLLFLRRYARRRKAAFSQAEGIPGRAVFLTHVDIVVQQPHRLERKTRGKRRAELRGVREATEALNSEHFITVREVWKLYPGTLPLFRRP